MATSLQFQSPIDSENMVLVTKDSNWTNIKVYAKGSLQYQSPNSDEIRKGIQIKLGDEETMEVVLRSELEITVNGAPYTAQQTEAEEKVSNVSIIFWVLTGFSLIGLLFLILLSNRFDSVSLYILIGFQVFAIAAYAATAILLKRGVYWFYFIGACIFAFFTALEFIDFELIFSNVIVMIRVLVRIALLVLLLRILPTILKYMRNSGTSNSNDVILDQ